MATKLFLSDISLNGNQLKSVIAEQINGVASISSPVAGRIVYDTADSKFKYYNGTAWIAGAEYSAATLAADDAQSKTYQIYDSTSGNTFQFRAIAVSGKLTISSTSGVITIDLASTAFDTEIANAIDAALASGGDIEQAIAAAKAELIGQGTDEASANTINGAKKYANDAADAVEAKLPIVAQGTGGISVVPTTDQSTGRITYTVSADASIFEFKGSVATRSALPASGQEVGNTYLVQDENILYAWDGSNWIGLGHVDSVTDVDTTASAGIQLTKSSSVVGLNVTPGSIAAGDTSVVTGGAVKSAIDTAVSDVESYADAIKVNGQSQSNQEITIDGSDIELTGYTKGSDTSAIAATDSVNEAIAKLENKVEAATASGVTQYKTTIAAATTSPQSISAATHGCGKYPMVQCYVGGSLVETQIDVNASGNVTISWNGSLSGDMLVVIVGISSLA
jgi:hypothetical protein